MTINYSFISCLWVRLSSKGFTNINLLDLLDFSRKIPLSCPFYREGNWRHRSLSNLPNIAQLLRSSLFSTPAPSPMWTPLVCKLLGPRIGFYLLLNLRRSPDITVFCCPLLQPRKMSLWGKGMHPSQGFLFDLSTVPLPCFWCHCVMKIAEPRKEGFGPLILLGFPYYTRFGLPGPWAAHISKTLHLIVGWPGALWLLLQRWDWIIPGHVRFPDSGFILIWFFNLFFFFFWQFRELITFFIEYPNWAF